MVLPWSAAHRLGGNGDDYTYYHHFENAYANAYAALIPNLTLAGAQAQEIPEIVNEILVEKRHRPVVPDVAPQRHESHSRRRLTGQVCERAGSSEQ